MAFLFLDGEACQRCRGTEEGGAGVGVGVEVGPLEAPTWPRGLPSCALLHVPFQRIRSHFRWDRDGDGGGGLNDFSLHGNVRCAVLCTVGKTAHSQNTDLIHSVGWMRQGFHIT